MGDVYAGHAPEGLMDPVVSWGTLGTHVVAARGSPSTHGGGAVSHGFGSLRPKKFGARAMLRIAAVLTWLPVVTAFSAGPATRFCTRPAACTPTPLRLAADHPAVAGWPDKYSGAAGGPGPRILHDEFAVFPRPQLNLVIELDVPNWPTWTTAGNDRWLENDTRKDKEMPYGELCYLVAGQLEIVPKDTGIPVLVDPGDFVTFPEGFVSDWTVKKELTWHYFLY